MSPSVEPPRGGVYARRAGGALSMHFPDFTSSASCVTDDEALRGPLTVLGKTIREWWIRDLNLHLASSKACALSTLPVI